MRGYSRRALRTHNRTPLQEFKNDDGSELFGEEKDAAAAVAAAADLERRRAVPGLLNPYQAGGMDDL